jgi:hypothetical protein
MKFIPIALALVATLRTHATANLRGASDEDAHDKQGPTQEERASAGAAADVYVDGDGGVERDLQGSIPEHIPGEYLVKFKAGASQASRGRAMAASRSTVGGRIVTPAMRDAGDDEGVTILRTGVGAGVPESIRAMIATGTVEYAEPNYVLRHDAISNDPSVGSLWGMFGPTATGGGAANQYGIGATTAWQNDKTDCSAVYVGIIDEGYMFTHPDLAANVGTNPGEIPNNGIDDDGNGYIDDVYGWDFVNNDKSVYDGGSLDYHGTHVGGTIGAVGGNGIGVAGVCWNVKLLSGKFLGANGGSTSGAIAAVDYFTNLKKKGLNIVATNNSWGGGGYSTALYDAIQRANNAGVLFIAAAGNSGTNNDATPSYPSSYNNANVIAVASITSTGALSSFSQYGATSVDIGAPGSSIYSTLPGTGGYGTYSGTSMATPHVAGAAALYKALNPSATAAQVKDAILKGATPTPSLNGKVLTNGRLNVAGFITPSVPTTSSPSKTPTPPTPPPSKTPTPPPTPATCRTSGQQCKKSQCGNWSGCAGTGTSCCCCSGLTCGGSGICRL